MVGNHHHIFNHLWAYQLLHRLQGLAGHGQARPRLCLNGSIGRSFACWLPLSLLLNLGKKPCGHSHHGQVFPISLVTGQLYEMDWGLLTRGAYNLIVSCGYGTWGPPLRIGNHPEIVDINLRFE
ncbi:MAG: hypothetical protein WC834_04845 [Eubacteriales bacterium]